MTPPATSSSGWPTRAWNSRLPNRRGLLSADEGRRAATFYVLAEMSSKANVQQWVVTSILDPGGWCARVDDAWSDVTGQTTADALGRGWLEAIFAEDRDELIGNLEAARRERRAFRQDLRVKGRDGTSRWALAVGSPRFDDTGAIIGFNGVLVDINSRWAAEEALRESAKRNVFLLASSDALRRLVDPLEIQRLAAELLGQWLGASRAHFVEVSNDGQWGIVREEYVDGVPSVVGQHRLDDYGPFVTSELRAARTVAIDDVLEDPRLTAAERDAAATLQIGACALSPLFKSDRPVALIVVQHVKPHRWSGEEIELIEATRDRAWDAVERALAEEALREADRRKDDFLAVLGHELRNPLASIQAAVQAIVATNPNERSAGTRPIDMIDRQVAHLSRLVDDLLDISRVNKDKIELRKERTDIVHVLQDALEMSRPHTERKNHRVERRIGAEPLIVSGDPMRLAQVVTNLVNNAAKFSLPGGFIEVRAEREADSAVIRVRDNGAGIAPEALPRLFDLFSQGPQAANKEGDEAGLGVGLALAKKLIDLHGGDIEARSPGIGRGSEFIVRLPLDGSHEGDSKEGNAARARAFAPRVLVVDDNHDVADSLAMLLESFDAAVCIAYNGVSAIEAAETFRPDVALIDIRMPGMDGFETARRMRARMGDLRPRLVALTGLGQEKGHKGEQEPAFDLYLTKPVSSRALQVLLSRPA